MRISLRILQPYVFQFNLSRPKSTWVFRKQNSFSSSTCYFFANIPRVCHFSNFLSLHSLPKIPLPIFSIGNYFLSIHPFKQSLHPLATLCPLIHSAPHPYLIFCSSLSSVALPTLFRTRSSAIIEGMLLTLPAASSPALTASQFKKSLFLDTVLILIRELIIGLQQNLALTMIFPPYFYNIK